MNGTRLRTTTIRATRILHFQSRYKTIEIGVVTNEILFKPTNFFSLK